MDVMTSEALQAPECLEIGSFRDRNGRVFYHQGEVYRYISQKALEHWHQVEASRFFKQAVQQGKVVQTELSQFSDMTFPQEAGPQWAGVLKHQTIPFISYPYEWSFSMLKDAALLQLELLEQSLEEGMILKDSSAFNFQWVGANPTFIDIPSFENLAAGESWVGYRQFCQLFLYPLMLQAYKDVPFQDWLRGDIDGIEPQEMSRLMSLKDQLKPGVVAHVTMQSKLQQQYCDSDDNLRSQLREAGFSRQLIQNNVRGLRKIVEQLSWQARQSEWSDYAQNNSYTDVDHQNKVAFIQEIAKRQRWPLVWDLGCNTGTFSRLVAENADYVVSMDSDQLAVERLYRQLRKEKNRNILPLIMNVAQPSSGLGWRGLERKGVADRARPSLVLCLALIHHVVISANIPVSEFLQWLSELGASVVIEFVTKEDPMVQKLLRNKEDQYSDYEVAYFEQAVLKHFNVARQESLSCGTRILYFLEPVQL